jgi:hypothetical protein
MRSLWICLAISGACVACQISKISGDGPAPKPISVSRIACDGQGSVSDATVVWFPAGAAPCVRLVVAGDGFSPRPRAVLTDHESLDLPTVVLKHEAGLELRSSGVAFDPPTSNLIVTITAGSPDDLPLGFYDLIVTNPNGKSGALTRALEVVSPPSSLGLCSAVDPAFGWVNSRTTIQICADNTGGNGLEAVPEAFLLVDPDLDGQNVTEIALIRESFLSASTSYGGVADRSVMSAVVPSATESRGAGIVVGGPYNIRVVNPSGSEGIIVGAFTVLADPPPRLLTVGPEQAEKGATVTMHLTGQDLKDPALSLVPRLARVLFLTADLAAGATCGSPTCFECGAPSTTTAGTAVDCTPPLASMASGAYLVRYEHLDDGSYSDFAAFAVTNPSGNLASDTLTSAEAGGPPALRQARYAHGAAVGRDDLGNRFVYVVGGQSGVGVETALDTVEVAALDRFGGLSAWTALPVRLAKKATGIGLVEHGGYLFVVGGRDEADTIQAAVYRARILGSDTAPVIGPPELVSGSLGAGTYAYRVSAVMAAGNDNVDGESLPSDSESMRLGSSGGVRLTWQAVDQAASYRIYRTATANELAGTEVLIATGIVDTSFDDDGSAAPGVVKPLPPGSTGVWMAMPSLGIGRRDASVTIAAAPDGTSHLYVLGGVTPASSPNAVNTYELAAMSLTGGVYGVGTFANGSVTMNFARAEFAALTLNGASAPLIAGLTGHPEYVVTCQGSSAAGALNDISLAKVGALGQLGPFARADFSPSADRYGMAGFLVNNFVFSIGGRTDAGTYSNKGKTAEVCPARNATCSSVDPPAMTIGNDSGISLSTGRYRPGAVSAGGYFYFIGGRADDTTVLGSCERGGYVQ